MVIVQSKQQLQQQDHSYQRNQRGSGIPLMRAVSLLLPSKTQPWFIALCLFIVLCFCVLRITLSNNFLLLPSSSSLSKDNNSFTIFTNTISDNLIKSVTFTSDIIFSQTTTGNSNSEPGTSSCFTTRTRMMYPTSPNDNGCYFENEFTKDSDQPKKNSELFDSVRPYCRFYNLRIDLSKVHSTRYGGEEFQSVMGQSEEDEVLSYDKGAFVAPIPNETMRHKYFGPLGYGHQKHDYVSKALQNLIPIETVNNNSDTIQSKHNNTDSSNIQCSRTIPGTTLFIQRDTYVNLFHVVTGNLFNIWLAIDSIQSKQPNLNVTNVVYLDARPSGQLDSTWKTLFGATSYLQHYSPSFRRQLQNETLLLPTTDTDTINSSSSNDVDIASIASDESNEILCFQDAVFVPSEGDNEFMYAWKSGSPGNSCPDPIIVNRFIDYVLTKYDCKSVEMIPNHIVFIDRRPYKSHPRSRNDSFERIINNLDYVASKLESILKNDYNITITYKIVQLDRYTMQEQIKIVRQAQILFGYHGAGLTHVLFMHNTNTKLIEIDHTRSSGLFAILTEWKYGTSTTKSEASLNNQYYTTIPSLHDNANVKDSYISKHIVPAIASTLMR